MTKAVLSFLAVFFTAGVALAAGDGAAASSMLPLGMGLGMSVLNAVGGPSALGAETQAPAEAGAASSAGSDRGRAVSFADEEKAADSLASAKHPIGRADATVVAQPDSLDSAMARQLPARSLSSLFSLSRSKYPN